MPKQDESMLEENVQENYARGYPPELPAAVWEERIKRCRKILLENDLTALLVYSGGQPLTGSQWARYFANYVHPIWNSNAFILIPVESDPILILNYSFMVDLAKKVSPIQDIRSYEFFGSNLFDQSTDYYKNLESILKSILKEKSLEHQKIGFGRQGMQGDYVPAPLDFAIKRAFSTAQLVDASYILWELVSVKTEYDIEMIKKSCEIGCKALKTAFEALEPGKRVFEIFTAFLQGAGELGAEFPGICPETWHFAFKDAVLGSERPNRPFWITSRKLNKGDMISIDTGTQYRGFPHDMARTAVLGNPTAKQKKIFAANLAAQKAMEQALRPGVKASELSRINIEMAKEAGFDKIHALQGHGIGFLENEPPIITPGCDMIIKENSVINLECVIYVPYEGMSYIEDTFLVRKDSTELLTTAIDRELFSANC